MGPRAPAARRHGATGPGHRGGGAACPAAARDRAPGGAPLSGRTSRPWPR